MPDHVRLWTLVDTLQQLALLHPVSLVELERIARQMLLDVKAQEVNRR